MHLYDIFKQIWLQLCSYNVGVFHFLSLES